MPWVDFGTGWLKPATGAAPSHASWRPTHCLEVPVVVALHEDVKPAHTRSRKRVNALSRWVRLLGQGLPLLLLCVFVCCWVTLSAHTHTHSPHGAADQLAEGILPSRGLLQRQARVRDIVIRVAVGSTIPTTCGVAAQPPARQARPAPPASASEAGCAAANPPMALICCTFCPTALREAALP